MVQGYSSNFEKRKDAEIKAKQQKPNAPKDNHKEVFHVLGSKQIARSYLNKEGSVLSPSAKYPERTTQFKVFASDNNTSDIRNQA